MLWGVIAVIATIWGASALLVAILMGRAIKIADSYLGAAPQAEASGTSPLAVRSRSHLRLVPAL